MSAGGWVHENHGAIVATGRRNVSVANLKGVENQLNDLFPASTRRSSIRSVVF